MDFDINQKIINDGIGFFSIENPSIGDPIALTCKWFNDALAPPHLYEGGGSGGGGGVDPFPGTIINVPMPHDRQ